MIWCFTKKLHEKHDAWAGALLWWSCQSPVAHSCGLLNHPNSFHGGMFKLKSKFDADSFLYSVILNAMATQYTCSLSGIYCPHWLVQWSHHCSHMHIPVHSPWLPGYIDVTQNILIILTMAGLFQTDLVYVLWLIPSPSFIHSPLPYSLWQLSVCSMFVCLWLCFAH